MSTPEENKRLVRDAFRPWEEGNSGPFFALIADDVAWTVIGSTPASGVFPSKQAVIDKAFGPVDFRFNRVQVDQIGNQKLSLVGRRLPKLH